MRGDLSETSAADACRELAGRGATGAFEVDGPDGPARVVFRDGQLVAAVSPTPRARLGDRLVGAGVLDDDALTDALGRQAQATARPRLGALLVADGLVDDAAIRRCVQEQLLDALEEVVGWHFGVFTFVEGQVDDVDEVPLELTVDDALDEVARRQREWEQLARVVPHLDAIPIVREHPADVDASLAADERAVFGAVDGARSVRELARALGFGELETTRAVHGLSLLGVVDVRLPEDEIGAALDEAFAALGARYESTREAEDERLPEVTFEVTPAAATDPDPAPLAEFELPLDVDLEPAVWDATDPEVPDEDVAEDLDGEVAPEPDRFEPAPLDLEDVTPAVPDEDVAEVADEDVGEVADEVVPPFVVPPAEPAPGTDVSEFLRELSRLAFDEPPAGEPEPRPRPRPDEQANRPAAADDRKKKRRGLFGLGG